MIRADRDGWQGRFRSIKTALFALSFRVQIPAPPLQPIRFSEHSGDRSDLPILTAGKPYRFGDIVGAVHHEPLATPLATPSVRFPSSDRYSQETAMNPFTADLTLRLRNPLAWTVRHPLQAIRRAGRLIVTLALSL